MRRLGRRWARPARLAAAGLGLGLAGAVCLTCVPARGRRGERAGERAGGRGARNGRPAPDGAGAVVGVNLAGAATTVVVGATGAWRLYEADGQSVLVRGEAGDRWRVERRGRQLRAVRADGVPTPYRDGALVVRPADGRALVTWNGKRYRGELTLAAGDGGVRVVNRVPMESYLRGVVPAEIGSQTSPAEQAAVEAQAVAARSYAYVRLAERGARGYDLVAGVGDQVYGGAAAERPASDAAVAATRGLVLTYAGRVVSAPYHSTCGGRTAEVDEVWPWRRPEPYLPSVSDRIPGTADRYYCDRSPTFTWARTYDATSLAVSLDRYLSAYATVPGGGPGAARFVSVRGTTPSGRVEALRIDTDRGSYEVRGDNIRRVLRTRGGEILNSTYFTLESVVGADGRLRELTVRGGGNGHGVGMCQWGALGRARAGQGYRTILRAYYPGATVAAVD